MQMPAMSVRIDRRFTFLDADEELSSSLLPLAVATIVALADLGGPYGNCMVVDRRV